MRRDDRSLLRIPKLLGIYVVCLCVCVRPGYATEVVLKDGRIIEGKQAPISSVNENPLAPKPQAGKVSSKLITIIDDDKTRTFISKYQIAAVREVQDGPSIIFRLRQKVIVAGPPLDKLGPIIHVSPFDEYGRRVFSMMGPKGRVDVLQGITEITPRYTRVDSLKNALGVHFRWDMRIATSSIPNKMLSKILAKQIDPKNPDERLQIVRFYIASERYFDARREMEEIIREFPTRKQELRGRLQELWGTNARHRLQEIERRQQAGQHSLAYWHLNQFPNKNVPGETLQKVSELRGMYKREMERAKKTLDQFKDHLALLPDSGLKDRIEPIRKEIVDELTRSLSAGMVSFGRLAAYRNLADDPAMTPKQKLSLAISGWLLGSNAASDKLAVTLPLFELRNLIGDYLREPNKLKREEILERIKAQESSSPKFVALLLANMKPPIETAGETAGLFELRVNSQPDEPPVTYYVQLPPEYEPHRRYPAIVSLRGARLSAKMQVDWWAGAVNKQGRRLGQAGRHGYIVIVPEWTREYQNAYEYSAREHFAVLATLRDACRRFSINTDRVFLSGHSMGGDAAWDIGLAHPDLWAGVIPIVATAGKHVSLYWENARKVPFYFVAGEKDGAKMTENAKEFDRYLTRTGFDVTIVEYLGRGHEHFQDEILRIFDWMARKKRDFFPEKFECKSVRTFDNFFWWVEVERFPTKFVANSSRWPLPRGTRPLEITGKLNSNNGLFIKSGALKTTVWLSPEMFEFGPREKIDFRQKIMLNNHRLQGTNKQLAVPSLEIMLEDVRTRGDRQHPFWAKLQLKR